MQGYIIKINPVKDEDLIVTIITPSSLITLYRFYGARHSNINLGYKIDFEAEQGLKSHIPRLRDVLHLGFPWLRDQQKLMLWHQFISLFHPHLNDTHEIEEFYFNLLESAATSWHKQNSKRIAVESYVRLLEYEGRLHKTSECFLCGVNIESDISLIRAYLPTHKECSHTLGFSQEALIELFNNYSTLFLTDSEIDRLYNILQEGL
ncbi:MAG: recombination protein RecO [Helicobacteraceae bacterium]|nr:recombination protein RecO [Helicobacteraceae bacterium]